VSQLDDIFRAAYGASQTPPPVPPPQPNQSLLDILAKARAQSVPRSAIPPVPQPTGLQAALLKAQQSQPRPGTVRIAPLQKVRLVKPRVFVSFDYENDVHYKRLLEAWSANKRFQFTFQDKTPQEIQSENVGRVKAVLTTKVQEASHVLVLCGQYANQPHINAFSIGCTNWIHFECQQALLYKKKIVAVLLYPNSQVPNNIVGAQGIRVDSFNEAQIIAALSA
jgi:hypothetical protein